MAIVAKRQTAINEGLHVGTIKAARETTKTFDARKGAEKGG